MGAGAGQGWSSHKFLGVVGSRRESLGVVKVVEVVVVYYSSPPERSNDLVQLVVHVLQLALVAVSVDGIDLVCMDLGLEFSDPFAAVFGLGLACLEVVLHLAMVMV